ncbi:TPA: ABC transporter permease subunit [Thermoplasmata archaeon]|nr:ABC transporter permease subunit [Thermoplasmata archaeon]
MGSMDWASVVVAMMIVLCSFMAASLAINEDTDQDSTVAGISSLALQDDIPPVANAGADRVIFAGAIITLNASGSTDNIGVTNYTWTFDEFGPQTLYGMAITREFAVPGVYNVTLNVSDAEGNWDLDYVMVTVNVDLLPPIAKGTNRTIQVGTLVNLSATSSTDNARIVNYTWNFMYDGEDITLYGVLAPFWFNKSGSYLVNLTVTDASGNTNYTLVSVQVNKIPTWLSENWLKLLVTIAIVGFAAYYITTKYRRDHTLWTSSDAEKLRLQIKSFRKTWKIFRSNRLGFGGFMILMIFIVIAVFAPFLSTVEDPNFTENHEPNQIADGWINPLPPSFSPSPYTGFVHPLGTDHKGQDVWSMTVYGTRASLYVGLMATAISALLGAAVGLAAGYFGRVTDEVLMRATDFFLVLPWFPLMIVMMAILGREFIWIIVVIGITSWPSTARIVRSQVLTVKERQFIERAKAVGAGDMHIISRHIMPNVMPLIFANTVLLISLAIFSESFLDFFGLGDPTVISWGTMLEGAYSFGAFYRGAWWSIIPPGLSILIMVLSFSLVGYALDDVLNPKLRRR